MGIFFFKLGKKSPKSHWERISAPEDTKKKPVYTNKKYSVMLWNDTRNSIILWHFYGCHFIALPNTFCLCWHFTSQSTIFRFSVMLRHFPVFIGWTSTKQRISVWLKDITQCLQWVSNLRPITMKPNTLPLSHYTDIFYRVATQYPFQNSLTFHWLFPDFQPFSRPFWKAKFSHFHPSTIRRFCTNIWTCWFNL